MPDDDRHRHLLRGPLNAAGLRLLEGRMDRALGRQKRSLLADLPARVVEIGSGTGANLRYLAPGTELVAVEPNQAMHGALRRAAAERGVSLELVPASAERLPFGDASVPVVISSLVLCTIPDPAAAVAEVVRVLEPGGRFTFVEHVAAEPGTVLARRQARLRGVWGWCFEGCDLCRDTASLLQAAGFARVELERFALPPTWLPPSPMIAGTAVR